MLYTLMLMQSNDLCNIFETYFELNMTSSERKPTIDLILKLIFFIFYAFE